MITFWGSEAQNEKIMGCFFGQQSAPKTTVICECSNINLFLISPHHCGVSDNMSQLLQLLFVTLEKNRKKEFILFIIQLQDPKNEKQTQKTPKNPVWWPKLLSLFCDNYHHYFLFYYIGQFFISFDCVRAFGFFILLL